MWLYPRGIKPDRGFFSEEEKQEYIHIEGSALEIAIIINQTLEGEISTMVVVKWLDAIKGQIVKVDSLLCGGLYKEYYGYIVPWSVTDPDINLNCFTWSKE